MWFITVNYVYKCAITRNESNSKINVFELIALYIYYYVYIYNFLFDSVNT